MTATKSNQIKPRAFPISLTCVIAGLMILYFVPVAVRGAGEDSETGPRPGWVDSQSRIVVGGHILHLGMGIGKTPEIARFKAEAMAVRNMISECSLPHREIVIWNRYQEQLPDNSYRAYARASLQFSSCEEGKYAPDKDRAKYASPVLERNQVLYDQLEKEEPEQGTLVGRIKEWTLKLFGKTNSRLDALEAKIKELESTPPSSAPNVTIVQQKTILVGGEASREARYQDCIEEYEQLMQDAQDRARTSKPPGNLASPQAAPAWNRAMRKLYYCKTIKSK